MKIKVFLLLVVCMGELCFAQSSRFAGTYYIYDPVNPEVQTPAPEGYEPFYISHFGRHGSRYCTSEYETLYRIFSKASKEGLLTQEGKDFFARYEKFYAGVKILKGNLNETGKKQQRTIASNLFHRFPSVFEGPTHVEAVSTESARVIMSMWNCLSRLQELDKEIDLNADASAKYAEWLQPSLSSNPHLIKDAFKIGKEAEEAFSVYYDQTVPWKEIIGKFFTSPTCVESPQQFLDVLTAVVVSAPFDGVLSPEEMEQIWRGQSAGYFLDVARFEGSRNLRPDYAAFTLGQMIESADADIASGATQLRLRFGHDSGIAPLMIVLDVNGCGRVATSLKESLEIFPNYNIPMAATVEMVFYRNAHSDILVKVLVNEEEATLPIEAVSGPYYSWDAFKNYYCPLVRDAKRRIATTEPLAALKKVDWGWKTLDGTKVEVGNASVDVFGSTQNISIARFPMWAHSVSVLESDGAHAAVTSQLGADSKALAAINGSYFDMSALVPVTYVKDEGKVICGVTTDGSYRCNGMLRIKDRKGKKVDIVSVDSLSTASAAKGWREAIVSGPILIEEGVTVPYENDGTRTYARFYNKRHPRTLLGYTADGWMYFIAVDGRFPQGIGMTVGQLQVLCESLGLYEALNLDGGGSTTLWAREIGVVNHPYDNLQFDHAGERAVPNVIIVK